MGAMGEFFSKSEADALARPTLTLKWGGKCAAVPDVIFDDAVSPVTLAAALAIESAEAARGLRVDPWSESAPLDICLGHWSDWMRQDDRDLGAKGQSCIQSGDNDDGTEQEMAEARAAASDAAAARASREIALATDAMINSLPRDFKAAIWRRCNIASVWKFSNMDFTVVLPQAEQALNEKLSKNVATRAFW